MLWLIIILMLPGWAVGMAIFWHVARPQKKPADTSNRFNKLRAIWWVCTKEDRWALVDELMTMDEGEIIAAARRGLKVE